MPETKNTYHQILKSTALFGGVQVFTIILSIIRSKFIAIFIGPFGMGISGMLLSTLNLISGITILGLENSAVKFISENKSNYEKQSKIIIVLRKILWFTGCVGALIMIVFAPEISYITFGDRAYSSSFQWISLALLFKQLSVGELVILQGLQKLKPLAMANLLGSFVGLLVSIPIYYYYKLEAIVPTIIISSAFSLLFSYYFSRKIKIQKTTVKSKMLVTEGKEMVQLGVIMSISSILTLVTLYALQIYIEKNGSLSEVGFYNAGFTLLNSYVGIIFSSMATDYFPRLSAVNKNPIQINKIVTEQTVIAVLIITPIVVLFEIFTPTVVTIFFSKEFIAIVPMISIGILGMLFRAVSWSMGYIILAKGDSKIVVWNALGFNLLFFALHSYAYLNYGLQGLGIAFLVYYIFHLLVIMIEVKKKYNFKYDTNFLIIYSYSILICISAYLINTVNSLMLKNLLFGIIAMLSLWFSISQLNKKINLKTVLHNFVAKFKK